MKARKRGVVILLGLTVLATGIALVVARSGTQAGPGSAPSAEEQAALASAQATPRRPCPSR